MATQLSEELLATAEQLAKQAEEVGATVAGVAPHADPVDIAAIVRAELAKLLAQQAPAAAPVTIPERYKRVYRCDLYPNLMIQALDMSALDRGERPQSYPIPGLYYQFRNGRFATNDDNAIRQLDWMIATPSQVNGEVAGGNPAIYVDDGGATYRCTRCEDFITSSRNAYIAHMKALHGVDING